MRIYITTFGDRTARRITLSNEDARFFSTVTLGVIVVNAAITQFTVMHIDLLGTLASYLGDTSNGLTFLFAFLYLLQHGIGHIGIAMQIVVNLNLDKVTYKLIETSATWFHSSRTQLHLGLTLKDGFLHIDGNSTHDTITNIGEFVVFVIKLLNGACDMLLESTLVCTTLCRMLTIYKGVVLFTILIGMSKGNLYILRFEMNDRIECRCSHVISKQIHQTITREDTLAIKHDCKTRIEVGIVTQHGFNIGRTERITYKKRIVGLEKNACSCLLGACIYRSITDKITLFKHYRTHFSIAI